MKVFAAFVILILLGASASGQNSAIAKRGADRATVSGIVVREPGSEPMKKALIELIAENQGEAGNYTAMTEADGTFRIENVIPGRYHLFAERNGFLDTDKSRGRSDGRLLTVAAGQDVKDLHIRLQAGAVIRGRVSDEDGDPMQNAEVTVLRQAFVSGHNKWDQAGAERTNDLGEFRVANLPAGNVYVSVSPPPDFKGLIEAGGADKGNASRGDKQVPMTYQTTYYPGTAERGQAAPIQLHPGDEFPLNFTLTRSPSVSIRGAVVNLPPRTSATILLQSNDFRLVLNGAEMHKDGTFVIGDVSPGNYTILAAVEGSAVPLMARESLQVGTSNIEGLKLTPQPGATIRGRFRIESKNGMARFDPDRTFLLLQSTDNDDMDTVGEHFTNLAHVSPDGSFQWGDVPQGKYYLQLVHTGGTNEGWFLKSVLLGGRDISDAGIPVNGGTIMLELVASTNGATVDGIATNSQGEMAANAVVVAVPEARMRGRLDRYATTVSDQNGHFVLQGIRPGDYTLLAWDSVDGEQYYNPDFVKNYEGQGTSIRVGEGDRKSVQLPVISNPSEQN